MPAEVTESEIALTIGLLEAEMPTGTSPSYPFPQLSLVRRTEKRSFQCVTVESALTKIDLLPKLGGRFISLVDKTTNCEILETREVLTPEPGGRRGATLSDGLRICLDTGERLNDMGPVAVAPVEADDEELPARLWLGEVCGNGLSFNTCVTTSPDRLGLELECRVLNRSYRGVHYNGGIDVKVGPGKVLVTADGAAWVSDDGARTLLLIPEEPFESVELTDGLLHLRRFPPDESGLGPRQADIWRLTVVPIGKFGGLTAFNREAALFAGSEQLRLRVFAKRSKHKIVLLLNNGQPVEATTDLYPEHALDIPVQSLLGVPIGMVLLDGEGNEVFRWEKESIGRAAVQKLEPRRTFAIDVSDPEVLRLATSRVELRGIAHTALADHQIAAGRLEEADIQLEQALLYNGDDSLAWATKAIIGRLLGETAEERSELLNAHYLAPLEPVLRAESFLTQTGELGREPTPLIRPLAEIPENLIEVGCFLLERNLFDEASRWLTEALLHEDLPMLHYLQAACFLRKKGTEVDAAEQVRAASQKPVGPPLPYRQIELDVLQSLSAVFRADQKLMEYIELAERHLSKNPVART